MDQEKGKYQPTDEEMKMAEESMTPEQADTSKIHEQLSQRKEQLSEKGKKAYEILTSTPEGQERWYPNYVDNNLAENLLVTQIEWMQEHSSEDTEKQVEAIQDSINYEEKLIADRKTPYSEELLTEESIEGLKKEIRSGKAWLEAVSQFLPDKE